MRNEKSRMQNDGRGRSSPATYYFAFLISHFSFFHSHSPHKRSVPLVFDGIMVFVAFDARGSSAAVHRREEFHERFGGLLMRGTHADRIGLLVAKRFQPIAGSMSMTGSANVDRWDQDVSGVFALSDVRVAHRAI